jgi:HEAT repeat protein
MALIKTNPLSSPDRPERQSERDCQGLAVQLHDASAEVRRWAARDLADCLNSSVALIERLAVETDQAVRGVIFSTLTRLGDDAAVSGLVGCLRCEDVALRNEAIEAMKMLPDAVSPIMHGLLHDNESDVRIFAVNILEALRHPDVESWLTDVIENDAHINVCATAVDLLGEVGSGAALPSLRALKMRFAAEPYIQFAADLAIKRILED